MNGVFQAAMAKMTDRANAIAIYVADPAEKPIVDKFGVRGAPMPLVLAIAPTGAATRAFPRQFDEAQLQQAFVSPCTAKCMKAIQDRHSILLCVQNDKTQFNQEAMQGVEAFKADPQYTKGTEIVMLESRRRGGTAVPQGPSGRSADPHGGHAAGDAARCPGRPFRRGGDQGPDRGQGQSGAIELRPRLQLPSHRRPEPCDCERLCLREIFECKSQLLTSFLAILLGITVIVSIKNISYYSEMAVAREMDSLGANVLVLPKSSTLQDYYAADMQGETIPEEYVTQLAMSDLAGLDNISPKLSLPVELQGKTFTLTGILPKSEFQAKAAWGGAGIFSRPIGCGALGRHDGLGGQEDAGPQAGHRDPGRQRSPRGRRRGRQARAQGCRQVGRAGQDLQRHRRAAADRHRG